MEVAISTVIGKHESDKNTISMITDMRDRVSEYLSKVRDDGYAVVGAGLNSGALSELGSLLDTKHPGERNLLDIPMIKRLARSEAIYNLARSVLGDNCFAVRGILFNKTEESNWKVTWHQDCVIAVASRSEIPDWGAWSIKAGVHHVRPTSNIMSRMLAVRIHLDDCNADNGALRAVPGSHRCGFPIVVRGENLQKCDLEFHDLMREAIAERADKVCWSASQNHLEKNCQ